MTSSRSITAASTQTWTHLSTKGLLRRGQADRRTNAYSSTRRGIREIEARRDWEQQYVDDLFSE